MKRIATYLPNYLLLSFFILLFFSCKTYKTKLTIEKINISFSGGINYATNSNTGGIEINVATFDTAIGLLKKFDAYSPLKKPVILEIKKINNSVFLKDQNENDLVFALMESPETNCEYNCLAYFDKSDKVSFTSYLAFFPYWHGFSALGGHPLFMRRHYYTLLIKKADGKKLKMRWTYSVQKYKPNNSRRWKWLGDYCVDNGGGLTLLKITN